MYRNYYGLSRLPFDLTPDPGLVFLSETHQEALAILKYGVITRKGVVVLTGEVGTGKTTLLQALLTALDGQVHVCMFNNPTLNRDEFFYFLSDQLKIKFDGNKAKFLLEFSKFLQRCSREEQRVLIVVDEAHVLSIDLLEEIRLLSNQDILGQSVLSIFLVGQPELNERMRDERLLPLRQRIRIRFHLKCFTPEETRQYIVHRLRKSGALHWNIFSGEALDLIANVTKGTPRLINILCDNALLTGYSESKPVIDIDIVKECVAELHFPGEVTSLPGGAVKKDGKLGLALAEKSGRSGFGWGIFLLTAGVTIWLLWASDVLTPVAAEAKNWLNSVYKILSR